MCGGGGARARVPVACRNNAVATDWGVVVTRKESGYPDDTQISVRRNGESGQDEEFSCGHADPDIRAREPSRDARHTWTAQVGFGPGTAGWGGAYLWAALAG